MGEGKHPEQDILSLPYREQDPEGETTLEAVSAAPDFNRWMYESVAPYMISPVLEIGSGIGNISAHVLGSGHETYLSDLRPHYCRRLREKLGTHPGCRDVLQLDLVHPTFDQTYASWLGRFGTVFALNVIEHIADDHLAISNCRKLLRPDGRLIILVPAYAFLYNRFDRELGHYRRYTRRTLNQVFTGNQLAVLKSFYFNLAGMFGWFVSGRVLGHQVIPRGQMVLYNSLVRLFRLLDWVTLRRVGLSVITIGQNTAATPNVQAA